MLLQRIDSPSDLRGLDAAELEQLAREIRAFIVRAVAATGGHLGSNLGVVELTLALHRTFDSPRDVILWDTGHQAYVHKLVTGRRDGFSALRQAGGLSGYPSRSESPHDWIENSHASTVLSYAHGLVSAFERGPDPERRVVAVVGDGALTGGMAYEALNNLGHAGKRLLIVLNDNGRSYAPTVSRLSDSLIKLRLSPRYVAERKRLERLLGRLPGGLADYLHALPAQRPGGLPHRAAAAGLLRVPGRALHRPHRRPRHRRHGGGVRARHRLRRPDRGARRHPEGPRLPAGRGRRREEPARHRHVRPPGRPAARDAAGPPPLHRRVRRGPLRPRRGRPRDRRAHRRDAGPDRAAAVRRPPPRPHPRRRHRRAAHGDRRRRHGDGRPAAGRRRLLDVPLAGVRPGQPRRGPARRQRHVRARPRGHHRRRRPQPPRDPRSGAAAQDPRDDGLRAARARSCGRCSRPR